MHVLVHSKLSSLAARNDKMHEGSYPATVRVDCTPAETSDLSKGVWLKQSHTYQQRTDVPDLRMTFAPSGCSTAS